MFKTRLTFAAACCDSRSICCRRATPSSVAI